MSTMSPDDTVIISTAEFHRNVVAYQDIALAKPVRVPNAVDFDDD
jgi:hypothetical protein